MNYVSGENSGCFGGEQRERHLDRKRHFPRQLLLALNSNTGGAGPLPVLAPLTAPINVVSTTIDARDFDERRFGEHRKEGIFFGDTENTLLIFTAIINLPAATTAVLNFQIVRSSGITTTTIGPTFSFNSTTPAATTESLSFAFQYFDTGLEEALYTYSVVLAAGSTATVAGVSITNATLSAIAVEFGLE